MNRNFGNNYLFHWSLRIIYMWRGDCLQESYCSHEQTTTEGTCPFVCHANCYHTNNYANCRTDGWDRMRKDAYWWRGIDSNTLKLQLLRMERPKHTLLDWNSWEILIKLIRLLVLQTSIELRQQMNFDSGANYSLPSNQLLYWPRLLVLQIGWEHH